MRALRNIEKFVVGVGILVAFLAVVRLSGWSPNNFLYGPQYRTVPKHAPKQNVRSTFETHVVPSDYPKLVALLTHSGQETVRWTSRSGEEQEERLWLAEGVLHIQTEFYVSETPARASSSTEKTVVQMSDANRDGLMDFIMYTEPSGRTHSYKPPFDQTSTFLWNTGVAVAVKYGKCCS